jgi:hypothetical protein
MRRQLLTVEMTLMFVLTDGSPSRNVTVALMAPLTELTVCQSDGCPCCERCGQTDPNHLTN